MILSNKSLSLGISKPSSLKNTILAHPNACISVSAISKQNFQLEVPLKVSKFLRMYPSFFEEFLVGPDNLPWSRLTWEAVDLNREEQAVYCDRRREFTNRVRRLILMSKEKKLPLRIIQGMRWYLGLPHHFLQDPGKEIEFVEMGDEIRGLSVVGPRKGVISVLQRNATRRMGCSLKPNSSIAFPIFPSKGLRLKQKIEVWLDEFQKLPYTSSYEDSSHLRRYTDFSEKRVVGVLLELLSLFMDHAAERLKLKCLQKHLLLP